MQETHNLLLNRRTIITPLAESSSQNLSVNIKAVDNGATVFSELDYGRTKEYLYANRLKMEDIYSVLVSLKSKIHCLKLENVYDWNDELYKKAVKQNNEALGAIAVREVPHNNYKTMRYFESKPYHLLHASFQTQFLAACRTYASFQTQFLAACRTYASLQLFVRPGGFQESLLTSDKLHAVRFDWNFQENYHINIINDTQYPYHLSIRGLHSQELLRTHLDKLVEVAIPVQSVVFHDYVRWEAVVALLATCVCSGTLEQLCVYDYADGYFLFSEFRAKQRLQQGFDSTAMLPFLGTLESSARLLVVTSDNIAFAESVSPCLWSSAVVRLSPMAAMQLFAKIAALLLKHPGLCELRVVSRDVAQVQQFVQHIASVPLRISMLNLQYCQGIVSCGEMVELVTRCKEAWRGLHGALFADVACVKGVLTVYALTSDGTLDRPAACPSQLLLNQHIHTLVLHTLACKRFLAQILQSPHAAHITALEMKCSVSPADISWVGQCGGFRHLQQFRVTASCLFQQHEREKMVAELKGLIHSALSCSG